MKIKKLRKKSGTCNLSISEYSKLRIFMQIHVFDNIVKKTEPR